MNTIETQRLRLITANEQILLADITDHGELGRLLSAEIPHNWPPALLDADTMKEMITIMENRSDPHLSMWYWIEKREGGLSDILIGSGGILTHPGHPDTVMIGYSILDAFHNQGFATEAIHSLIPVIFSMPGIHRVLATTHPHLKASIRVLEKNDFVPMPGWISGEGIEEGTLAYVKEKRNQE